MHLGHRLPSLLLKVWNCLISKRSFEKWAFFWGGLDQRHETKFEGFFFQSTGRLPNKKSIYRPQWWRDTSLFAVPFLDIPQPVIVFVPVTLLAECWRCTARRNPKRILAPVSNDPKMGYHVFTVTFALSQPKFSLMSPSKTQALPD